MLRPQIYQGQLLFRPACRASAALRDRISLIIAEGGPVRAGDGSGSQPGFFERLIELRKIVAELSVAEFLTGIGLTARDYRWDCLRLRAVSPGGHLIPAAANAYTAHRDTWYANPQCQINLWMPLHDVTPADSFGFYADYLTRPVANDSEQFDYADLVRQGGFGARTTAVYPKLLEALPVGPEAFELESAGLLFFSAAHLHQTLPNRTERTRFSVDLRLVHVEDHAAGLGTPNVDNRSRGEALADYRSL